MDDVDVVHEKVYQPRARRACLGELVQIDGRDHRWFEERAPACTLLVYVDDATSRLMMLHFTQTESTFSYFEATRAYLERYGKPVAFYSDKYSVFRSPNAGKSGSSVTQFGRAMYELNIDTFCANSSSAKGRVERAHLTLQDRLVKEMRLRRIKPDQHGGRRQRLRALLHGSAAPHSLQYRDRPVCTSSTRRQPTSTISQIIPQTDHSTAALRWREAKHRLPRGASCLLGRRGSRAG